MAEQDERAAFEVWAKSRFLDCSVSADAWGKPVYLHPHIESMFSGWYAARDAISTQAQPAAGEAQEVRVAVLRAISSARLGMRDAQIDRERAMAMIDALAAAPQPAQVAATHQQGLQVAEPVTQEAHDQAMAQIQGVFDEDEPVPQVGDVPIGFVLAPDFRGYAKLGIGEYLVNHSATGNEPELVISVATDEEKAGRVVGDDRDNPPGTLLPAERMAVRIAFANEAGLAVLEKQIAYLREAHFPAPQQAQGSEPDMVSVCKEDANNYCRILTVLGMEEEGDPVAAVETLIRDRDNANEALAKLGSESVDAVACRGENCGATDGVSHSSECVAEAARIQSWSDPQPAIDAVMMLAEDYADWVGRHVSDHGWTEPGHDEGFAASQMLGDVAAAREELRGAVNRLAANDQRDAALIMQLVDDYADAIGEAVSDRGWSRGDALELGYCSSARAKILAAIESDRTAQTPGGAA